MPYSAQAFIITFEYDESKKSGSNYKVFGVLFSVKYHISDVARILGITPSALHFLESKDIIEAKREENGYRYYDENDIFRLLSYFKYHSMGIPLKDIGNHFSGKEKDRGKVIERVRRSREKYLQLISHYQHLCALIGDYLEQCEKIPRLIGNYEFAQSQELVFVSYGKHGWISHDKSQQKEIQNWVDAMPATRLSVLCTDWESGTGTPCVTFGYSIKLEEAKKLNLPYNNGSAVFLPSLPCYHTIAVADSDFAFHPEKVFINAMEQVRGRNLNICAAPFGNILLVDVDDETLHPIVDLWFPIR